MDATAGRAETGRSDRGAEEVPLADVIRECADAPRPDQDGTWITDAMLDAYVDLHRRGLAHSVEAWAGERLVGGLYGVALGAAFFGESMFSRVPDASKVALVHLAARLSKGGFRLLDTQFETPHLRQFGVVEIAREEYRARLARAVRTPVQFPSELDSEGLESFLQSITQTS